MLVSELEGHECVLICQKCKLKTMPNHECVASLIVALSTSSWSEIIKTNLEIYNQFCQFDELKLPRMKGGVITKVSDSLVRVGET